VVEGSRCLHLGDQRAGAAQRDPQAAAEILLPDPAKDRRGRKLDLGPQ